MLTRLLAPSLVLLILSACAAPDLAQNKDVDSPADDTGDTIDPDYDADADGFPASSDCDDTNPEINPAAEEICDGVDNDCNDEIDEAGGTEWYADADGDGYGDGDPTISCDPPGTDWAAQAGDCDDSAADTYPGADVECLPGDKNCDGVDDDLDTDNDGYAGCEECDDTDATINPDGVEVCNDLDDDCNGEVDDAPTDGVIYYVDADTDGYGDASLGELLCDQPEGSVEDATDCDDTAELVNPGATEVCNGIDDDCDTETDEPDAADAGTWFSDTDGDGYGDPDAATVSCEAPSGTVADNTDCDDTSNTTYPGATDDWYDGVDADCSSDSDYDADADTYDSIDYGGTDCDDAEATTYPGAADTWYDGVDADCAGDSDYDADGDGDNSDAYFGDDCDDTDPAISSLTTETWYDGVDADCAGDSDYDADADGYDSDSYGGTDCDDTSASAYPGASDTWYDGVDTDCAGDSDYDADADGYDSEDYGGTDCDDVTSSTNPGAADTWYDGVDADCSGGSDYDADGDGEDSAAYFGDDCDDTDSTINSTATDTWYDGVDSDCAEDSDYDADADGYDSDSYGGTDCDDTSATTYPGASDTWYDGVDTDCAGDSDYDADADGYLSDAYGGTDCDDTASDVNPGATETDHDGTDQNCDGNDGPEVALDSTELGLVSLEGYSAVNEQSFTVSNSGEGSLGWTASADETWVGLSATTGSEGDTVTVTAETSGLAAGSHTATIIVQDDDSGSSSESITVTLEVAETWSGTITTGLTRDGAGRVSTIEVPDGTEFGITHDGAGRVTDISASTGEYVSFIYDGQGHITDWDNDSGTVSMSYDELGGVEEIIYPDGGTISYTNDDSGRVTRIDLPSGDFVRYVYSGQSVLPDRVVSPVHGSIDYTYDADGRLETRTLDDGSVSTWTYDATFGLTESIVHEDPSGAVEVAFDFTYSDRGLIESKAIEIDGSTETIDYSYDGDGRLIEASSDTGSLLMYSYDEGGNRTERQVDGDTTTYLYDSADRMLQAGDQVFEYDEVGRMTARLSPEGVTTYTWDAFDRLITVDTPDKSIAYTYAADGTRLSRDDGDTSTNFYHDLSGTVSRLLQAEADDGTLTTYLWGADLAVVDVDGTNYGLMADQVGSVHGLSDGSDVHTMAYDPFGELSLEAGLGDSAEWMGFAGEERDPDTGLIWLRQRWYDPSTGRFLSADTKAQDTQDLTTWNAYVYCHGDPINFIDPTGEWNWTYVRKGVLSIAGGVATLAVVALTAPVSVPAGIVAGIAAMAGISGVAFGAGNLIAGMALDADQNPYIPGGLVDITAEIAKAQTDDPVAQLYIDGLKEVVQLWSPDLSKMATIPEKLSKLSNLIDKMGLYDKMQALDKMGGDMNSILFELKKNDPEAWERAFGWMFNEDGTLKESSEIPADDERGGIYINASATVIGDLSQIEGAAIDEQTGQLILYGEDGGLHVDGVDNDMFMTSLQWLSTSIQDGNSFTAPGVTIENDLVPPEDPSPPDSTNTYHGVGFFGGIEYTELGNWAFEADRILKGMNLCEDNEDSTILYDAVLSGISEFDCGVDVHAAYYDGTSPSGWVRYWLEPDEILMTVDNTRDALEFTRATVIAQYEDQDDPSMTWAQYDDWTEMLSDNYDDIAVEIESWEQLKTGSKMVAVAYWLYEEGYHETLNWDFIDNYEVDYYDTPWWTIEGEVTIEFEYDGATHTEVHRGGAGFRSANGNTYASDTSGDVQAYWDEIYDARADELEDSWTYTSPDGDMGVAVALPIQRVASAGGAHLQEVDLIVPTPGAGAELGVLRSYSSVLAAAGRDVGMGPGWAFTPYSFEASGVANTALPFDAPYVIDLHDATRNETVRWELSGYSASTVYWSSTEHPNDDLSSTGDGEYSWERADGGFIIFDDDGQLLETVDALGSGLTLTWTGDELDEIAHTSGRTITLGWDSDGMLSSATTDNGLSVSYSYDADGLLSVVTDISGNDWSMAYDTDELLSSLTASDGTVVWEGAYDDMARLTEESWMGMSMTIETSLYDDTTVYTDGSGVSYTVETNSDGQITAVTDGMGNTRTTTWDEDGYVSEVEDGAGSTLSYEYDPYGNLWKTTDGDGNEWEQFWTVEGDAWVTYAYEDPDGDQFYIYRNSDGTIDSVWSASFSASTDGTIGSVSLGSEQKTATWSADGMMESFFQGDVGIEFSYTSDGKVSTFDDPLGGTRSYSYDSDGQVSAVSTASGTALSYTWDSTNPDQLSAIAIGSVTIQSYGYDALGRVNTITDAESNVTRYTYGSEGLIASIESEEGSTLSYTRDGAGRLTDISGSWGLEVAYAYDDAGRLTSSSRTVELP